MSQTPPSEGMLKLLVRAMRGGEYGVATLSRGEKASAEGLVARGLATLVSAHSRRCVRILPTEAGKKAATPMLAEKWAGDANWPDEFENPRDLYEAVMSDIRPAS